jgi:hypothetical protein
VLGAVLAGDAPARDDMLELADEVLEQPLVRAALEVKAGGTHATLRAGELAVALLARTRAEEVGHG